MAYCSNCSKEISNEAFACPACGQPNQARLGATGDGKSRITAGILALLVGGLGVHKFYLNKVGQGIVYLLFFWTFIPAIIAFVEGIIYLTQSDEAFATAQNVRAV